MNGEEGGEEDMEGGEEVGTRRVDLPHSGVVVTWAVEVCSAGA